MNPIVYYGVGPACYRSTSHPLRSTQANKVSRILDVVTISAKAISHSISRNKKTVANRLTASSCYCRNKKTNMRHAVSPKLRDLGNYKNRCSLK